MSLSLRTAMVAAACSVLAEALALAACLATARNASNGMVYHLCSAFHAFPETVRFYLFRDVENHPSLIDNVAMAGAFFGTALLQWFVVFLVGAGVLRLA